MSTDPRNHDHTHPLTLNLSLPNPNTLEEIGIGLTMLVSVPALLFIGSSTQWPSWFVIYGFVPGLVFLGTGLVGRMRNTRFLTTECTPDIYAQLIRYLHHPPEDAARIRTIWDGRPPLTQKHALQMAEIQYMKGPTPAPLPPEQERLSLHRQLRTLLTPPTTPT